MFQWIKRNISAALWWIITVCTRREEIENFGKPEFMKQKGTAGAVEFLAVPVGDHHVLHVYNTVQAAVKGHNDQCRAAAADASVAPPDGPVYRYKLVVKTAGMTKKEWPVGHVGGVKIVCKYGFRTLTDKARATLLAAAKPVVSKELAETRADHPSAEAPVKPVVTVEPAPVTEKVEAPVEEKEPEPVPEPVEG